MRPEPLEPRRIRSPRGAYGWVDLRIVTEGHLQRLDPQAALIYLFLCTVGDRHGISFWGRTKMARVLNLPPEAVDSALPKLATADLVVIKDRVVQVLPIPGGTSQASVPIDGTHHTATVQPVAARETQPYSSTKPQQGLERPESELSEDEIRVQEPEAHRRLVRFTHPTPERIRRLATALALEARNACRGGPSQETPGGSRD